MGGFLLWSKQGWTAIDSWIYSDFEVLEEFRGYG